MKPERIRRHERELLALEGYLQKSRIVTATLVLIGIVTGLSMLIWTETGSTDFYLLLAAACIIFAMRCALDHARLRHIASIRLCREEHSGDAAAPADAGPGASADHPL